MHMLLGGAHLDAVLVDDPSRTRLSGPRNLGRVRKRMERTSSSLRLAHSLKPGATAPALAAGRLRTTPSRALLAAGYPALHAVNRLGATALHYAFDPPPVGAAWYLGRPTAIIELLISAERLSTQPDRVG